MVTLDDLKARLTDVHQMGDDGFIARCPAHRDDKPSLKVSRGRDGRVLVHCHAGCSAEAVVSAVGLRLCDLMPDRKGFDPLAYAMKKSVKVSRIQKASPREVAHYDYTDESGRAVYRVIRLEPKSFRQARINKDGSLIYKMDGVTRYPYRLDEVIKTASAGGEIVIVEGEKDAETLRSFGFTTTCNAGGAGKFDPAWAKYFKGASLVRVIADNDSAEKKFPGQRHAWAIRTALAAAGVPTDVFTMPQGKDVTEYVEMRQSDRADIEEAFFAHEPWPDAWKFTDVEPVANGEDEEQPKFKSLADFPPYSPEETNDDILVKGRWLERGGSAWWISTAGTGKSIASLQFALSMTAGLPFAGLKPNLVNGRKGLKFLIVQSEDSPSRIAIDREDITEELKEQHPDVDWAEMRRRVMFYDIKGKVGADFIEALDAGLERLRDDGNLPDVVILNPFLAYVGGPVTDGSFVTPFFRGGEINHKETVGLQFVLEKFNVGILIFHHTPKPPSEKDLDAWMKSPFPEYQGAGSSDITNWGRSFITMMKVKGEPKMVCLTAGKNGGEIGWDELDGARRHYLAWSSAKGVTGAARHAWRELTNDELDRVNADAKDHAKSDICVIVDALKERPMTANQIAEAMLTKLPTRRFRAAWKAVSLEPAAYGLAFREARCGRSKCWFYGLEEATKKAVLDYEFGIS